MNMDDKMKIICLHWGRWRLTLTDSLYCPKGRIVCLGETISVSNYKLLKTHFSHSSKFILKLTLPCCLFLVLTLFFSPVSLFRFRMVLPLCAAGRQILLALTLLLYFGSGEFSVCHLHSLFPVDFHCFVSCCCRKLSAVSF